MDFFGAQENARRKTWRLGALFAAAVLSLVLLTNVLVAVVYASATGYAQPDRTGLGAMLAALPIEYWLWITFGVLGMVALASLYKYAQVRGGGRAVAESLGGRLLSQTTTDLKERRLLNVVEEMAIASGIPVPPVYVIEEPSINAFAAGFSPQDAVIGVNRGTLEYLDRDELQGVVGHEFSHILNGDTRINLRLIAVLHGILFIGLVGRGLLHGVGRGAARRRTSGASGGAPVLALGLGLLVIGYAGTFFGNVIKAAVSRQREFLADAASVQFTRNPRGIAGALRKIGGLGAGSAMTTAAAGEASHMFFGQVGRVFMNGLLSTHPPLERRIKAVDPRWNGQFPVVTPVAVDAAGSGAADAAVSGFTAATSTAAATPDQVADAVGRLDDAALEGAQRLIGGLPAILHEAAHDPFSARALMYALVVDEPATYRQYQLEHLYAHAERGMLQELDRLQAPLAALDEVARLSLVDMAIPALKELSAQQYRTFIGNLVELIKVDRRIDLMEWVLHRVLLRHLRPHFESVRAPAARHGDLAALGDQAAVLLSTLAREGTDGGAGAADAFAAGMRQIGMSGSLIGDDDPNFARLNRALADLQQLKPLVKPQLVKACAATVLHDAIVTPRQAALLRGVAASLDCPLPPGVIRGH